MKSGWALWRTLSTLYLTCEEKHQCSDVFLGLKVQTEICFPPRESVCVYDFWSSANMTQRATLQLWRQCLHDIVLQTWLCRLNVYQNRSSHKRICTDADTSIFIHLVIQLTSNSSRWFSLLFDEHENSKHREYSCDSSWFSSNSEEGHIISGLTSTIHPSPGLSVTI